MDWKGIRVGFALTGSHCTLEQIIPEIEKLVMGGAEVVPVISETVETTDTRFGKAAHWIEELERLTGKKPIASIVDAESIGPQKLLDIMVIAPCTGNTLAKLANGIIDSPVLMGTKAHLRNGRPVVLAVSTNDGLSINAKNLGLLLNMKNIYLVPFGQDDPVNKANSLVAHLELLEATLEKALTGKQIQPVLVSYPA